MANKANKVNKITVLLDDDEFQRFDAYCETRGFKKSTLIVRLIREHLKEDGFVVERELPLVRAASGGRS